MVSSVVTFGSCGKLQRQTLCLPGCVLPSAGFLTAFSSDHTCPTAKCPSLCLEAGTLLLLRQRIKSSKQGGVWPKYRKVEGINSSHTAGDVVYNNAFCGLKDVRSLPNRIFKEMEMPIILIHSLYFVSVTQLPHCTS